MGWGFYSDVRGCLSPFLFVRGHVFVMGFDAMRKGMDGRWNRDSRHANSYWNMFITNIDASGRGLCII